MADEAIGRYMRANLGPHMIQGLRDLLALLPDGLAMAEIGVFAGESSRVFMDSGQVERLYAVDPWAGDYDQGQSEKWHCPFPWPAVRAVFEEFAVQYPSRILTLPMTSVQAAAWVPACSLDFVYIDGNHSYRSVREDIVTWLPKLHGGGWLGGHDWSPAHPGVRLAVEECKLGPVETFQDTSWLVQM
jgi:hypothetical protein